MGKKLNIIRKIAQRCKAYYETDDFKDKSDLLLEDVSACRQRIAAYLSSYKFEYKYTFKWDSDIADIVSEQIYDYMKWNINEFITDAYAIAWHASYIDGIMFGQQTEELTSFHDAPDWKKHKEKYRKAFEELDYFVDNDCKYAYYNMEYEGVALDLDNGIIPIGDAKKMIEWLKEWNNELTATEFTKVIQYLETL